MLSSLIHSSKHLHLRMKGDDSKGFFIQPTVILSKDPQSVTLREEIFGPVLTVSNRKPIYLSARSHETQQVFLYEDEDYEKTLDLIDTTTDYGLTGAMSVIVTPLRIIYSQVFTLVSLLSARHS